MPANLFFLGISKIEGGAIILASLSYHSDTDLNTIKEVLNQPNILVPNKLYNLEAGQLSWHLLSGKSLDFSSYYSH